MENVSNETIYNQQQEILAKLTRPTRNRWVAILLAILLGGIGIHKFYLRRYISGVLYLVFCWTFIPLFLSFLDALVYLIIPSKEWRQRYS